MRRGKPLNSTDAVEVLAIRLAAGELEKAVE